MEYQVKAIKGYEGRYEIDTEGTVWSLNYNNSKERRPLAQGDRRGYACVDLYSGTHKSRKRISIHRLVAEAFLPDYSEDLQVDHINCNKKDNRVENIRMVTAIQNSQRAKGKGSYLQPSGKYRSTIKVKHKSIHLGMFDTEEEAMLIYQQAKKFYHFQ